MKPTPLLITSILLVLFTQNFSSQNIVINEFMAKNTTIIQDLDGDFSDWIELYNTSNTTINLLNYSLSDDKDELKKWIFPNVSIPPQGYLIVFASNKSTLNLAELHSNFKISSNGEKLYLSNSLGILIDSTSNVSLSSDQSFGRVPDGNSIWTKIDTPTPKSTNNNSNGLDFSHSEGFYTSPFSLKINSILPDTIYYTLNGSVPNENSSVFNGSILVDFKSTQANSVSTIPTSPDQSLIGHKAWEKPSVKLDKANILRCATYKNGRRTSEIYTKTFFIDAQIRSKYTLPIVSLITEENNFFSADSGIYVPGINHDINRPEQTGNYFMHGKNWERAVHIEYFKPDGKLGFSQDAGVRIHGGSSRQAAQKSLRFYARNEYGEEYFNYKLLPQKKVDQFKRFILRASMGDWHRKTTIADVLAQKISSPLNIDYQDFQPVIVFINGEYWGIHNIRDRIDKHFIAYSHNIEADSVEFKGWTNTHYENLINFIENNDLSFNNNYDYVTTQIDIDNYIDYTIAELFVANYDWPGNNMKLWREKPLGKWRWVLYDLDRSFENLDSNMFAHATSTDPTIGWPNSVKATFLFRNLLKNNKFKKLFINRYVEILNQEFNIDSMKAELTTIKKTYQPEISSHIDRWNYLGSSSQWEEYIDTEILTFLEKRPCVVKNNTMEFFKLSSFDYECDKKLYTKDGLTIASNPNNGHFYIHNSFSDIIAAKIRISSNQGQLVYEESNINLMKNERKYFDLSHLPSNTYIFQLISTSYLSQRKIIIIN